LFFVHRMNKKTYQREIKRIKQEYKGCDSKKKLLLIRLDTKHEYWGYKDQYHEVGIDDVPGLSQHLLGNTDDAVSEVHQIYSSIPNAGNYSNVRFYINQPYYSRSGNDPFPCYDRNHPAVHHIMKLVLSSLGSTDTDLSRLNVIVRCYNEGDVLGFHTDREEFGEDIYGMVIYQRHSDGLILVNKATKSYYPINEGAPVCWHLTGDSRWKWVHGYAAPFGKHHGLVRISITYRFYQDEKHIPQIQNSVPLPTEKRVIT
jgi:hypothetical protein